MSAIEHRRTRVPGKIDTRAERVLTPPPVAGYCLWLAARLETAYADGDLVGSWTDWSGNGHHATEAGSYRPTYKENILNGHAVLRFAGAQRLILGDLSGEFTDAATLFVVWTNGGDTHYNLYESHYTTIDTWWSVNGAGYFGIFRPSRYSNWPTGMPTAAGTYLHVLQSTTPNYICRQNGAEKASRSDSAFSAGAAHAISYPSNGQTGKYLTGDIAEILVYPLELSTADIEAVEDWLNALYAIY